MNRTGSLGMPSSLSQGVQGRRGHRMLYRHVVLCLQAAPAAAMSESLPGGDRVAFMRKACQLAPRHCSGHGGS